MKSNNREELLLAIAELCKRHPNWRLGQLLVNVAGWADRDVWDVEDAQLVEAIQLYLQQSERSDKKSA
jgi:hypothetical protein